MGKNIMNKEELLSKIRGNIRETYDMPSLDDIKATKYEDSLAQFISMSETVGNALGFALEDSQTSVSAVVYQGGRNVLGGKYHTIGFICRISFLRSSVKILF